jgi:hypothetical protein
LALLAVVEEVVEGRSFEVVLPIRQNLLVRHVIEVATNVGDDRLSERPIMLLDPGHEVMRGICSARSMAEEKQRTNPFEFLGYGPPILVAVSS